MSMSKMIPSGRSAAFRIAVLAAAITVVAALGACSPKAPDESSAGADEATPLVVVEFSMDSDCGVCHSDEQASAADSACLASRHADQTTCITCHSDESALTKAHDGATVDDKKPTKLKRTAVDSEACLSCHAGEDRIAATADVTVCTDSEGTVVNPHDLPASGDHGSIVCSDCHAEHKAESADELAPKQCVSCHHADVYQCYTCHE